MKINLNQELIDIDGTVIKDAENKAITLKELVKTALIQVKQGDENASADEKIKRTILAKEALLNDEVEWEAEDVAMVKERINKFYPSPVAVFEAYRLIEGK